MFIYAFDRNVVPLFDQTGLENCYQVFDEQCDRLEHMTKKNHIISVRIENEIKSMSEVNSTVRILWYAI